MRTAILILCFAITCCFAISRPYNLTHFGADTSIFKNERASPLTYLSACNGLFRGKFKSARTDCEGRLLCGGDLDIENYGIGHKLEKNCDSSYSLVCGGTIKAKNCQASKQRVAYGKKLEAVTSGSECGPAEHKQIIDFDKAFEELETTSKDLCKLPPTDAIIIDQQHTAIFAGTTSTMNVFQWDNVKAEISTFSFNATVESTWNLINIFGEEVELSQISFKLKGAIEKRKILFNFCKAKKAVINSISVQGSILAPLTELEFNNGNIEGTFCGKSFNGSGEFHDYPYISPCNCIPCRAEDAIILPNYSMFIQGDAIFETTDNNGRLAVGGNAILSMYQVGTEDLTGDVMVVVGDCTFDHGSVKGGVARIGGEARFQFIDGVVIKDAAISISFTNEFENMIELANYYSELAATGTITENFGAYTLTGHRSDAVNRFNLKSTELYDMHTLTIEAPEDSWVVINVDGNENEIASMGITIKGGVKRSRILWNFFESDTVVIKAISVQGSVLAPKATVSFTNGNVEGNVYGKEVGGTGQVHYYPWENYVPECDDDPCTCFQDSTTPSNYYF